MIAYVEFFNGGSSISPSMGKYCKDAPNSIITSDNTLFVRYVTTAKEPRAGFSADIVVGARKKHLHKVGLIIIYFFTTDVCGGTIRTDTTTTIEVPNQLTNGPITCVWKIISEGNLLSYWFETLNIESDNNENCTTNYVEVAEMFQRNGAIEKDAVFWTENHNKYCGSNTNRTVVNIATDQVLVTLNSTRNIGRKSQKYFKMYFRTILQGNII